MTIDRLGAVETRREPVPVIDIFAGAERPIFRTYSVTFPLAA